jgi:hypothetical protein
LRDFLTLGVLSGALVVFSSIPYLRLQIRNEIKPTPISWVLWAILGFVLLVTYKSSGAGDSVWIAVAAFLNPILVLLIMAYKERVAIRKSGFRFTVSSLSALIRSNWIALMWYEKLSLSLAILSFLIWIPGLAQFTLYLTLAADCCGAYFTLRHLSRHPDDEKPGPWTIYALGCALAYLAIDRHTWATDALPIYMLCMYGSFAVVTGLHRIKTRVPVYLWGWI